MTRLLNNSFLDTKAEPRDTIHYLGAGEKVVWLAGVEGHLEERLGDGGSQWCHDGGRHKSTLDVGCSDVYDDTYLTECSLVGR